MGSLPDFLVRNEPSFRSPGRLVSLYSDFSSIKHVNEDGYKSNVSSWIQGLEHAVRNGINPGSTGSNDVLILHLNYKLVEALGLPERGQPLALGTVMDEGLKEGRILPLDGFLALQYNLHNPGLINLSLNFLSKSLREVERKAWNQIGFNRPIGNRFIVDKVVVLSNVEEASKRLESRISTPTNLVDRIYSRKIFEETFRDVLSSKTPLSAADFRVLLKYLQREKGLISYNDQVVKFRKQGESPEVNSQDETIASLKSLLADLDLQIEQLSKQVDICQSRAKAAMTDKNRERALRYLKSKKIANEQLARRSDTWFQMKAVYDKVAEAADQAQVLSIMENSATVLKQLHSQIGGVERVEKVVDDLNDQISNIDEVTDVIGEGNQNVVIDDGEIEDELNALIEKETAQKSGIKENAQDDRIAELSKLSSPSDNPVGSTPAQETIETSVDKAIQENSERLKKVSLAE